MTVSGLSGTVEALSVRTIRLRAGDGSVHIIPFSAVTSGVKDVLGAPVNERILLTEPFTLEVHDKVTGETVLVAEECTWTNVSFNIRQGAITGKDARAQAIRIRQAAANEPPLP